MSLFDLVPRGFAGGGPTHSSEVASWGAANEGVVFAPRLAVIPRSVIKPLVPQFAGAPSAVRASGASGYFLKLNRSNKSPIAGILRGT